MKKLEIIVSTNFNTENNKLKFSNMTENEAKLAYIEYAKNYGISANMDNIKICKEQS
jgi:hypothetical protein